ncbi:MAG: substrate-binding periplasmic protein [Verrucomicrobiales bacterium]
MPAKFRFLTLATLTTAILLLANCANTAPSPDILRIGVTADSPPMIFKSGGQITGLEADMGQALAAEMGKSARFVNMSWNRLLPSLQAGKIDIIMSNMTITEERRMYADFTTPYLQVGKTILVRSSEYNFYRDPKIIALVDKKIGVEAGTTSDAFAGRYCPRAPRVELPPSQAIQALNSGKIDVYLHDSPIIWSLSVQGASQGVTKIPKTLTQENLGWAVRRGDSTLLSKANATIAKWKKNGQLESFANRWMPLTR